MRFTTNKKFRIVVLALLTLAVATGYAAADPSHASHSESDEYAYTTQIGHHYEGPIICWNGFDGYEVYAVLVDTYNRYYNHYDEWGNLVQQDFLYSWDGPSYHEYVGSTCP